MKIKIRQCVNILITDLPCDLKSFSCLMGQL